MVFLVYNSVSFTNDTVDLSADNEQEEDVGNLEPLTFEDSMGKIHLTN